MIPADVASQLRQIVVGDQPAPTQPATPAKALGDALSEFIPGQRLVALIQSQLPNGTYRATIAQRDITLALPFSAKSGDALELEVVDSDGKLALAVLGNKTGGKTDEASATTRLTTTGQFISDILSGLDKEGGKRPQPASLNNAQPLVNKFPEQAADLVPILKTALSKSGMFYEAHQARWIKGQMPVEALLQEPQGQHSVITRQTGSPLALPAAGVAAQLAENTNDPPLIRATAIPRTEDGKISLPPGSARGEVPTTPPQGNSLPLPSLRPPNNGSPSSPGASVSTSELLPESGSPMPSRPSASQTGIATSFRSIPEAEAGQPPATQTRPAINSPTALYIQTSALTQPKLQDYTAESPRQSTAADTLQFTENEGNLAPSFSADADESPFNLTHPLQGARTSPDNSTGGLSPRTALYTQNAAISQEDIQETPSSPAPRAPNTLLPPSGQTATALLINDQEPLPSTSLDQSPDGPKETIARPQGTPTPPSLAPGQAPPAVLLKEQALTANQAQFSALGSESPAENLHAQAQLTSPGSHTPATDQSLPEQQRIPNTGSPPHAPTGNAPPSTPTQAEAPSATSLTNALANRSETSTLSTPNQIIAPDLAPLVQQQLEALASQTYVWQGQVWPGQQMYWEITEEEAKRQNNQEESRGAWTTHLRLQLPRLGDVSATLRFSDTSDVEIALETDTEITRQGLSIAGQQLLEQFHTAGLNIKSFAVSRHAESNEK